jgi:hypothetical protein
MNTLSKRGLTPINWPTLVMVILGFWLSASLFLDFILMPSLLASGMMSSQAFATVGYLIFGVFNRVELLCAALVLSGFLVLLRNHSLIHLHENLSVVLAGILLVIPLVYTYFLTPEMSSLGLSLNLLDTTQGVSSTMLPMQWSYWILEVIKLIASFTLLRWCYRDSCPIA